MILALASESQHIHTTMFGPCHFLVFLLSSGFVSNPLTKSQLGRNTSCCFCDVCMSVNFINSCYVYMYVFVCLPVQNRSYHHKSDHMEMQIYIFKFFTLSRFWNKFFCHMDRKFLYDRTSSCVLKSCFQTRTEKEERNVNFPGWVFVCEEKRHYNDIEKRPRN